MYDSACCIYVSVMFQLILSALDTIVGVNKYTLDHEETVDVLSIDNTKTIQSQVRTNHVCLCP